MCKAQRPFRWHDRFSCQADVLADDFFVVFAEDKVINHFAVRGFEAVIITAFRTELEFRFIRIIQEDAIPIAAHKERDTFVKRVFSYAVTRLVTIPHLIRLSATVHLARFLTKTEKMLVTAENLIFHFPCSFTHMPLVGIVTKQEFLILVEYLKTHGGFIHPDAQLRGEYFVAGYLLVHMNRTYLFQFLIDDGKRSVLPLKSPVGREVYFYYGRAAKLQLQGGAVRQVKSHPASLLRERSTCFRAISSPKH